MDQRCVRARARRLKFRDYSPCLELPMSQWVIHPWCGPFWVWVFGSESNPRSSEKNKHTHKTELQGHTQKKQILTQVYLCLFSFFDVKPLRPKTESTSCWHMWLESVQVTKSAFLWFDPESWSISGMDLDKAMVWLGVRQPPVFLSFPFLSLPCRAFIPLTSTKHLHLGDFSNYTDFPLGKGS